MGFRCVVPNCWTNEKHGIKGHKFPKAEKLRIKWVRLINCENLTRAYTNKERNFNFLHVCHKHFENHFILKSGHLRQTAYPTLFTTQEIESGVPDRRLETVLYLGAQILNARQKWKGYFVHTSLSLTPIHTSIAPAFAERLISMPPEKNQDHIYTTKKRHVDHTYCGEKRYKEMNCDPSGAPPILTEPMSYEPSRAPPTLTEPMSCEPSGALPTLTEPMILNETKYIDDPCHQYEIDHEEVIMGASSFGVEVVPAGDVTLHGNPEEQAPSCAKRSKSVENSIPRETSKKRTACNVEITPAEDATSCTNPEIHATSSASVTAGVENITTCEPPKQRLKKMKKIRLISATKYLTPRCKNLYDQYKKSRRHLNIARKKLNFNKTAEDTFDEMTAKMNPWAKNLFWLQIRLSQKKKHAWRFSLEEKVLALTIFKQSPKCYNFLKKFLILPSKTTLRKLLQKVEVKAGINSQVFEIITEEVKSWNDKKKLCNIIFDEMALESAVTYNEKEDDITGFVNVKEKTDNFADHALVFMIRGAVYKWQQAIAFYFTAGAVSNLELKKILKDVIAAVSAAGLEPISLVCDQGSSFRAALNNMKEDTRRQKLRIGEEPDDTIQVGSSSLHIVFDAPHLIKGIRNNFLTKDILFEGKKATWQDIVDVYETDANHTQSRMLNKLTDEHVIPTKIKKMKVKNCVQVLSSTVSKQLKYTSAYATYTDGRPVSSSMKNTAEVIDFFDSLFDSVNGASFDPKAKPLKKAVTEKSPHHKFWKDALKKLSKCKFIKNGREMTVPSLRNWTISVKSMEKLWQILKKKNVKVMRPKYFNSDPIENFFGRVRAYNNRNNDPNCLTFMSTFKALLITGFIKFHNPNFNCEDDSCKQLVKFTNLFNRESISSACPSSADIQSPIVELPIPSCTAAKERLNIHSRGYTAGWVIRKMFKKLKCDDCQKCFQSENVNPNVHTWITLKEYNSIVRNRLVYPSENTVRYFGYAVDETNAYLGKNAHKKDISKTIKDRIKSKYAFDFVDCERHKDLAIDIFIMLTVRMFIFNWCNIINRILKGSDIYRLQRMTNIPFFQKKALDKFKKRIKNKRFNK